MQFCMNTMQICTLFICAKTIGITNELADTTIISAKMHGALDKK